MPTTFWNQGENETIRGLDALGFRQVGQAVESDWEWPLTCCRGGICRPKSSLNQGRDISHASTPGGQPAARGVIRAKDGDRGPA